MNVSFLTDGSIFNLVQTCPVVLSTLCKLWFSDVCLVVMGCNDTQVHVSPAPARGVLTRKMYTPARTAPQNLYPHWHKMCDTLPLLAQNLGPKKLAKTDNR